jgi:hypothetical protein
MNDQLNDFVNRHRDEFDSRTPGDRVWQAVKQQLPGKSLSLWNSVTVWRAAALLLAGLATYLYVSQPAGSSQFAKASLQTEFRDLESFYTNEINEKVALIDNLTDDWDDEASTQDIQKLDAMYQVLLDEMKSRPTEKVRDALVLNLLVRIDLLNQQIQKLEKRKEEPKSQAS